MPVAIPARTVGETEHQLWGVTSSATLAGATNHPRIISLPNHMRYPAVWSPIPVSPFHHLRSTPSSITEQITDMFNRLQELQIRIPAPKEVWQYFENHPGLITLTEELSELAAMRLPDAILSLEISQDPEENAEYAVLYARFHHYTENTVDRIWNVRKEFLSRLKEEEEWPLLTTDFRCP